MDEITVARSGAEIAAEINIIKKQTARVCLSATVEIGRLLVEAKAAVPFGEWGTWLERNVAYSQSTANNIMRLYQEYGEQEQIGFFEENRMEIFGDLTPSQAVALLGLEPAERRQYVEAHDMDTVSVRDIQREVKARQEAEALAAAAREELQNTKRMAEDLKEQLSEAQSASGDAKASEKELRERKFSLAKGTKYLLDFMFYAGILVTISLPFSLKYIGKYLEAVEEHYLPAVIIFAILGVLALLLINELRKMIGTVLAENCFVPENVASLRRMGDLSFFIAAMSAVRCVVYLTIAMLVIILVFIIAGMFSKVLAMVFEEAVRYKKENDLTI